MDYISSSSIKNIEFSQLPKRTSSFEKNLMMMQELVQQQQDKYSMMKEGKDQGYIYNMPPMQYLNNSLPLNLDEDDEISL